jgi:hypothetical protein
MPAFARVAALSTIPGTTTIPWQAPQVLPVGSFVKIGVQYDF